MRRATLVWGVVGLMAAGSVAMAQPRDDGDRRGPGGREGFRPPSQLMRLFDTDRDGTISAAEIEGAADALRKMDENEDGKLTADELPQRSRRGRGGRGPGDFLSRFDENEDGKITKEELPERFRDRFLESADTNKDDVIDEAEIEAMQQRIRERFEQRRRDGDGERRRRFGRDRRGDADRDGNRPRRERPDAE